MSTHAREGNHPGFNEEHIKPWDLKEEFKYAPKKPDCDPWKILLDPLLEREKKRCDAWNTEIQNLLIFAGLFSGLVTAFIIESYKILQSDPNNDIVSLLAHIATRLDNPTLNLTAGPVTSVPNRPSLTFAPSPAAVRVNIFWFISLILSLTVILSGIITMQWLREHQAYTGQSSKDMIAILHMRVESLEKWYVKEIITTFPLFLAVALVLFFAGIIDFLHVIGNRKLLEAVATLITITLILLVTSTILPASQCTFLYIWLGRQSPPSPCPYKSPQSGFFHGTCYYISSFFQRRKSKTFIAIGNWLRNLTQLNSANKYALLYLTDTWSKRTWAEVDLCWLSVREACLFPEDPDGYYGFVDQNAIAPLFDISKTFHNVFDGVRLPQDVLAAVYHCFHEISTPFVSRDYPKRKKTVDRPELDDTFSMIQWRTNFLHKLLHSPDLNPKVSEEDDIPLSAITFAPVKEVRKKFHSNISILHHHSIFMFIDRIKNHYPKELSDHRVELGIRLLGAHYQKSHETHHPPGTRLPSYLRGEIFDQRRWKMTKNDIPVPFFEQYVLALIAFFEGAAHPDATVLSDRLLAHNDTAGTLESAAWDTYRVMSNLSKYEAEDRKKALNAFMSLLGNISTLLLAAIAEPQNSTLGNPIHLLYFSAIYLRRLNCHQIHGGLTMDLPALPELNPLSQLNRTIATMRRCKSKILDNERNPNANQVFKNWLSEKDRFGSVVRFTPEWWSFLGGQHDEHTKDSEPPPGTRPKRPRPQTQTQTHNPAPAVKYPPAKSPWRFQNTLQPPSLGRVVSAESNTSIYSDDSYASTHVESPITSGYSTVISSPLDEKGPSFRGSPTIPEIVPAPRTDFRDARFFAPASSPPFPQAHLSRLSNANVSLVNAGPTGSAPTDKTWQVSNTENATTLRRQLGPSTSEIHFPVPIHSPGPSIVISDNPYDTTLPTPSGRNSERENIS